MAERQVGSMTRTRSFEWDFGGSAPVRVGIDERGAGETVVMLPALSSISTRHELDGLAAILAPHFRVVTVDWPGFGEDAKPQADWTPALMARFLEVFFADVEPSPFALVAAGHGAGYALRHLAAHPGSVSALVTLAPTWRGPFPTMMGGQKGWFGGVRSAMDAPIVGPALYALNMSRPVMDMMVRGHVYVDRDWLAGDALRSKEAVVAAEGARFGSVRFVSGGLDPFARREDFIEAAGKAGVPHLTLHGEQTPRRSKAEMVALGEVAGVEAVALPHGKLSVYEEFAGDVGPIVLNFLSRHAGSQP